MKSDPRTGMKIELFDRSVKLKRTSTGFFEMECKWEGDDDFGTYSISRSSTKMYYARIQQDSGPRYGWEGISSNWKKAFKKAEAKALEHFQRQGPFFGYDLDYN